MLSEIDSLRRLSNKPIEFVTIPQELIPPMVPLAQRPFWYPRQYGKCLNEVVTHLAECIFDNSLRKALLEPESDGGYAFRGIKRKKDPLEPIHPFHPDSTLLHAVQYINENGIDKKGTLQVWFAVMQPGHGLFYALPESADEVGILVVSKWMGMEFDGRFGGDYHGDYGMNLKGGYTYRDLLAGSIIFDTDK